VNKFRNITIAFLLFVLLWVAMPKSYLHVFQSHSEALETERLLNHEQCNLCTETFCVFESSDFTFKIDYQNYTYNTSAILFLFAPDAEKIDSSSGLSPPMVV
jgi:hypothetical protein